MKFSLLRLAACVSAVLLSATLGLAQGTALTEPLAALAKPADGIVGLNASGALLRSTNSGVSFTQTRAADVPVALTAVAASGATVVAMGDATSFVRSTNNGTTWSTLAFAAISGQRGPVRALAANGTTWVAVGQRGDDAAALRSTTDGASWTVATTPVEFGSFHGVAWTGTRWVAVGGDDFFGYIYTSTDGASWSLLATAASPLRAVASNAAGKVLAVGDAGLMLYATDHAATPSSFVSVGNDIVSEDLVAVIFTTGDSWVIGGDNSTVLTFNGATSTPGVFAAPTTATTAAVTALLPTGTGSGFFYSTAAPAPHGPISLQIALVTGQLQLTLVGAQSGTSYHLESSTTLVTFATVSGSTRAYSGGPAPTWTFPAPASGGRIFYRAKIGPAP